MANDHTPITVTIPANCAIESAAGDEGSRYAIPHAWIEQGPQGPIACATNGRILAVIDVATDRPLVAGEKIGLPRAATEGARKAMTPKARQTGEYSITLNAVATYRTKTGYGTAPLCDDVRGYPQAQEVLPKSNRSNDFAVCLNVDYLYALADAIGARMKADSTDRTVVLRFAVERDPETGAVLRLDTTRPIRVESYEHPTTRRGAITPIAMD